MKSTPDLSTLIPFAASVLFRLLAWGAVCQACVWPPIRELPLHRAAQPKLRLHLHLFRFFGLAFIVPGVVGPTFPAAIATPPDYGYLVSMEIAWLALMAEPGQYSRAALRVFGCGGLLTSCSSSTR